MTQILLRSVAFLGAYAPLWLILAVRVGRSSLLAAIALVAVAVFSSGLTLLYASETAAKAHGESMTAKGVVRRDDAVMTYLFTYVLPFLGFPLGDAAELVSALIFLLLLFVLYVRTNLFYVNPILSAANYRIYEVDVEGAPPRMLITKRRFLAVGSALNVAPLLEDDVYIEANQ